MEEWKDTTVIAGGILTAILFIGFLSVSMLLLIRSGYRKAEHARMQQQLHQLEARQELLKAQIDASEQEKQRIASELHDHFGVSLSTLKLKVYQLYNAPPEMQSSFIDGINHLLDRNIEDMRDLSHGIYPPMLKQWGLVPALQELAGDLSEKLEIRIFQTSRPLSADEWTALQLFRICQEFIQNSMRHGKAGRVDLHLRMSDRFIALALCDNGIGFDPSQLQKGAGLIHLENRSQAIGSVSRLHSVPGKGTRLLLLKKRP